MGTKPLCKWYVNFRGVTKTFSFLGLGSDLTLNTDPRDPTGVDKGCVDLRRNQQIQQNRTAISKAQLLLKSELFDLDEFPLGREYGAVGGCHRAWHRLTRIVLGSSLKWMCDPQLFSSSSGHSSARSIKRRPTAQPGAPKCWECRENYPSKLYSRFFLDRWLMTLSQIHGFNWLSA